MPHKKEKERFIALLLAGLFLLAACSAPGAELPTPTPTPEPTPIPKPTPEPTEEVKELWGFPIDDTHDAFEVPTGGRLGIVLVTVELGEEGEHQFSVWTENNLEVPLQTMIAEGLRVVTLHDVVDANFDGYVDFGYVRMAGPAELYYNYWLWDEEQGQFVLEPQLMELPEPQFDETDKTVSFKYWKWYYEHGCIYQWEGTELVCVRDIYISKLMDENGNWLDQYEWVVKALVDDELVEIYRETSTASADSFLPGSIVGEKWYDLNYHGE